MLPQTIAFLVYGDAASGRDALMEERYKDLADAFLSEGFRVRSVLYNDQAAEDLYKELLGYDGVLVWVNPIEQGNDRGTLDRLLVRLAGSGCFVSTHPDTILKIGTKDVLFKTQDMEWGSPMNLYTSHKDFVERFPGSFLKTGIKVLKQYRGNGGNGVFKVTRGASDSEVTVLHARSGSEEKTLSWADFFDEFRPYFLKDGLLVEQEWNGNHANGMVRCYLSGDKVAGFGYQEVNALYELTSEGQRVHLPPSKRYYFTENCGLFSDLKETMEKQWVPQLQKSQAVADGLMPVLWDADFFINHPTGTSSAGKYSLCEINVSCVSPFPPSSIKFIVEEVTSRLRKLEAWK